MFEGDFDNAVFADRIAANAAERRHIGWQALPETRNHRPLRPGGSFVIADVISSEVQPKRNCRTRSKSCAIPPHVRMLPGSELTALVEQAGFAIESQTMWDKPREFEEWMGIVNDASRVPPLRAVVRALASAGASAGMGLSEDGGEIRFFHRWNLIAARKPADG
jgi:hypothetical protein